MRPYKERGKGTFVLDRRFRHVGRIKRASGTDHAPTFRRLDEMLSGLYERGRLDVLRAIQGGTYTPMQVYALYRINEMERLPTMATVAPLEAAMKAWIEKYECSAKHTASLSQSLRHIMTTARAGATVADLPNALSDLREKMRGKHARSYNLARAAAQAFVRDTMRRTHPLWAEVTDIGPLKVTPQRKRRPLLPAELNELAKKLPKPLGEMALAMAMTGMGPGEYWGRWEERKDRVHVYGTKRKGRDRDVPRVAPLQRPVGAYKPFREAIAEASGGDVTPYDMRRTYANLMEAAGVPRTRRKLYMGHGAGDVTDLYEQHEVESFLVADGKRLSAHIKGQSKAPRKSTVSATQNRRPTPKRKR